MIPMSRQITPVPTPTSLLPNTPLAPSLAQGSGSDLIASWAAPAVDFAHGAATSFNLQFSLSGVGSWTAAANVTSPHLLSGLPGGTAIDVQIQGANAAGTSPWSATATLTTNIALPNTPPAPSLAQGLGSDLTVSWAAPSVDSAHSAATAFNLQFSPSQANLWTTIPNASNPYDLSGLAAGEAIDVQVQAANAAGTSAWSATSTLITSSGPFSPNAPSISSVAPTPDGTNTKLTVTWTAPATDSQHSAATGYNVRYSPTGAGTWTSVSNVTSPYTITGLSGAAQIDVEVQAVIPGASPSAWSALTTGTVWGATVVPATWTIAAAQVHSTSVAPNGGVNMTATAAPTAVTGAAFGWSVSPSICPTTNLIAAAPDGQTNGWGQYFSAPATPGTYYLWSLAQGSGDVTIGALVSSAITVS
jgi:hypothetical protein